MYVYIIYICIYARMYVYVYIYKYAPSEKQLINPRHIGLFISTDNYGLWVRARVWDTVRVKCIYIYIYRCMHHVKSIAN